MPNYKFFKFWNLLIVEYKVNEASMYAGWKVWSEKYGVSEKSKSDFMWQLFNTIQELYTEQLSGEEYFRLKKSLYLVMEDFLRLEKRSTLQVKKAIARLDLDQINSSDYKCIVEIIGVKDCFESKDIDGLKMDWKDANVKQLLPYKKCKRPGGCCCVYGNRIMFDENDNAIMK